MRTLDGKGESKEPLSVPVYIFDNKKDARAQANLYRQKGNELGGVVNIKSNDIVTPDYDGHFEADVSVNGALVVTNEGQVKIVEVKGTLLNYDITFSSGVNDAILLKGTNVYAKRMGMNFKEQAPLDDGPNVNTIIIRFVERVMIIIVTTLWLLILTAFNAYLHVRCNWNGRLHIPNLIRRSRINGLQR